MPRRLLSDMDAELLLRLANRTDITPAMRKQFIFDAYLWVCKTFIHPELQSHTPGVLHAGLDAFDVLDDDVWFPDFVFDVSHQRPLEPRDLQYIERQAKSVGNPSVYHWWGKRFFVDRRPQQDVALKVFYIKTPQEFTTNTVIGREYDIIIIGKAAELGFTTVRDYDDANGQKQLHTAQAVEMKLPVREEHKNSEGLGVQVRFS